MTNFDAELAHRLAAEAGELLLQIRDERGYAEPRALREAGARRSHDYIVEQLRLWRPDDAVLSEEALGARDADEAADRLDAQRVWIVDPLDGTREYAEEGRSDWAVHVALWSTEPPAEPARRRRRTGGVEKKTGGRLAAGAIALPAQGTVLSADPAPGGAAEATPRGAQVRIAASRTRPPSFLGEVAADLGALLVPMGSAGAKIAAVITGEVDAYVHAGGQYEWDSAAPVAVALAQGLHASRLDGSPLVYNRADPMLPDLVVCRPRLARSLLDAIRDRLALDPAAGEAGGDGETGLLVTSQAG
ncbi:MAG: 3'(2'),5'-bisphosphate nucleotidase CysQ [Hamadaea sp.]|nr:3'(2'),5'-bisphosphate nucleotidase CysQ [Hamadaea sp.]